MLFIVRANCPLVSADWECGPARSHSAFRDRWPNGQSGRLMFYHDHAYGMTRQDVYAGEAAGYLLTDPDERTLNATYAPGGEIPLIIQDKAYVNINNPLPAGYVDNALLPYNTNFNTPTVDPLWTDPTNPDNAAWGKTDGSLRFPHVYMPNQNPNDLSGASMYGRWDYGPWFCPIFPAGDPCNDYYTGDPDNTFQGGAPTTQAGFGPNTRTVMQIRVLGTTNGTPIAVNALNTSLATVFNADPSRAMIVSPNTYARISDTSLVANGSAQPVSSISVTSGGAGYKSAPTVAFVGGGSGASATATVTNGVVTAVNLSCPTCGGSYTSPPLISFYGGNPTTPAIAVANLANATPLQPKTIQELFDPVGRMNATLGVEVPFTSAAVQTTIPYGHIDPVTEVFPDGVTQLWKITHNGVDTHAIHFHLFNVQVINRIGWDGMIKPPWPEEIGWKETVKMNPLEDIVVALRAKTPTVPFALPDSVRMLDPTQPAGSTVGFFGVDPNNNPVTVANQTANFGHEYVWHCHLLGHEENDMMRPISVAVMPAAPSNLTGSISTVKKGNTNTYSVNLTWKNNANGASAYVLQRASNSAFTTNLATFNVANATTFVDTTVNPYNAPYYYRVAAQSVVGSGVAGYPAVTSTSAWSNVFGPPTGIVTLNSVTQATAKKAPVVLKWSIVGNGQRGFTIQRATNASFTAGLTQFTAGSNVFTYSDTTTKAGVTYWYRVIPTNFLGIGTPSNALWITPHA